MASKKAARSKPAAGRLAARVSRATGTPRRVISTSSPDSTASKRAESCAYCKQKPTARAWATLRLRSLWRVGHTTNVEVGIGIASRTTSHSSSIAEPPIASVHSPSSWAGWPVNQARRAVQDGRMVKRDQGVKGRLW